MAYVQTRHAKLGELLSASFEVLAAAWRPIAIYLGAFAALGLLLSFNAITTIVSVIAFVAYFPAQYWLYREVLSKMGMSYDASFRVFSLFFMSCLLGMGIGAAMNLFYIPGIILGAKWIMSPTYLVRGEGDLIQCIGASWRASKDNTLALSLAFTIMVVIGGLLFPLLFAVMDLTDGAGIGGMGFIDNPFSGVVFSLALNVVPVLLMSLSVASYRLLADDTQEVAEVFA